MEIIKRGVDPKTKPLSGTCRNCMTEITFLPVEAEYVSDQRDGDFYKIKCPVCADTIIRGTASGNMQDR